MTNDETIFFQDGLARFSLDDLAQALKTQMAAERQSLAQPLRPWTDTRTLTAGDCFVALVGANFDGHSYVKQAYEQGACAAIVNQAALGQHPEWQALPNLFAVPDTTTAYLQLGQFHRERCKAKIIGLTGSSGKTTVKEMLHAALSTVCKTQKTEKNFNNEVGVAQTLLGLSPETDVLVLEMAMRGPGQIALLSQHAKPDIGLIINIGPAHLEFFKRIDDIAHAKLEIIAGMNPSQDTLVVNADDPLLVQYAPRTWHGRLMQYRLSDAIALHVNSLGQTEFTTQGHVVTLSLPGKHMVSNALAVMSVAAVLCQQQGYELWQVAHGLSHYQPDPQATAQGRWQEKPIADMANAWVINDAYNANPQSMMASISAFLENPMTSEAKKYLLLGGMRELGDASQQYHVELGEWVARQPYLQGLWVVGEEAPWIIEGFVKNGAPCPWDIVDSVYPIRQVFEANYQAAPEQLQKILVKGSRYYQLNDWVEALIHNTALPPQSPLAMMPARSAGMVQ